MGRIESKPGSARFARELAQYLESTDGEFDDGHHIAATDCQIAAAALRTAAASRVRRTAVACAAVVMIVGIACIGVADRNGDGRANLADVVLGAQAAIERPALTEPAMR